MSTVSQLGLSKSAIKSFKSTDGKDTLYMHYMRVDGGGAASNRLYIVRFLGLITFHNASSGTDVVFPRMFTGICAGGTGSFISSLKIPLFSYSLGDVEMNTGVIEAASDGVRFVLPAASASASINTNISMMSFLVSGIKSVIEG